MFKEAVAQPQDLGVTHCGDKAFRWGERTYVMGIVNVTPDSFSGDGLGYDVDAALSQAKRFVEEGADIIDVGGESTRPGHTPISVQEELRRVIPVLEALSSCIKVPLSIDTFKARVARRAISAGASMVNDQWGLKHDPSLAEVAAEHGVPLVLMHNQKGTSYKDLIPDIIESLRNSIALAVEKGVPQDRIIVDPGIGFGKTWEHSLEVLSRLGELKALGRPILVGTSRKSVIGKVLDLPADQRAGGTAATVSIAIANGADMVRVHDVKEMVQVSRMADAIVRGWPRGEGHGSNV